jgi:hypothetical protein
VENQVQVQIVKKSSQTDIRAFLKDGECDGKNINQTENRNNYTT